MNDSAAVNKILEESSITHAKRAINRNLLRSEDPRFQSKDAELEENLRNAVLRAGLSLETVKQAEIPLIEPISAHVIKAYYTLRLLRSRDIKIKLLHTLNYFRSIQKRLTLDVKEYYTRERAIGDIDIVPPQFGTDANGNPRTLKNGQNGPGGIFNYHPSRKLDDPDADKFKSHPYQH